MQNDRFEQVIEDQIEACRSLLFSKNSGYNPDGDKLENFKIAAELQNTTPRLALMGMLAKHTVSVFSMARNPHQYTKEEWDEKLNDEINYRLLLAAILQEERDKMILDEHALTRSVVRDTPLGFVPGA